MNLSAECPDCRQKRRSRTAQRLSLGLIFLVLFYTPLERIWLIALIVLGFPVASVGIWSFVCAIPAVGSGYRCLGKFRVERAAADQGEALPTPWYAMIGLARYRGEVLTLRSSRDGLTFASFGSSRIRRFAFHGNESEKSPQARCQLLLKRSRV